MYPLPMAFPTSGGQISVRIRRDGWDFFHPSQHIFAALPASERLELRRSFEAQVALAQNTPTKGDT